MFGLLYASPAMFAYELVLENHFVAAFTVDMDSCGSVFCLVHGAVECNQFGGGGNGFLFEVYSEGTPAAGASEG
jgi:hypothetical protein